MNSSTNNLNFCGLKENQELGKKVLEQFRQEFGSPKSSTLIGYDIENNFTRYDDKTIDLLIKERDKLREEIYDSDYYAIFKNTTSKVSEFIDSVKTLVLKKGKANCKEDSIIISDGVSREGELPVIIYLKIQDKDNPFSNYKKDHFTTVFGLKEDADITNPKTWGDDAVIVDAWKGIVMKASDAINNFAKFMQFEPDYEELKIFPYNLKSKSIESIDAKPIDLSDLIKKSTQIKPEFEKFLDTVQKRINTIDYNANYVKFTLSQQQNTSFEKFSNTLIDILKEAKETGKLPEEIAKNYDPELTKIYQRFYKEVCSKNQKKKLNYIATQLKTAGLESHEIAGQINKTLN